jgi:hypothetical protein
MLAPSVFGDLCLVWCWQSVVLFKLLGSVPSVLWVVRFSSVVFVLICFSLRLFRV